MVYTDTTLAPHRAARWFALVALITAAGCASSGAVPQPFPGANTGGPDARGGPSDVRRGGSDERRGGSLDPPETDAANLPNEAAPGDAGVAVRPPFDTTPGALALASALELRGVPYRNGGSDPNGFDCSGLVQWVFARNGRSLPRETREQFQSGREIELAEIQPGDLLFFDTGSRGVSHVGIALDGESFVHAPNSNGVVRLERYTSRYWSTRYLGARRIE